MRKDRAFGGSGSPTEQQAHTLSVMDLLKDVKTSGESNQTMLDRLKTSLSDEAGSVDVDKIIGAAVRLSQLYITNHKQEFERKERAERRTPPNSDQC